MPPEIRLTVVSWPATSSRMQVESSSPSLRTVPVVLDLDQPAEQVVAGRAAPLGQQLEEVAGELEDGVVAPGDGLVGQEEVGVEPGGQGGRPVPEALLVLDGHAEHVADDADRQRVGEAREEVDGAGLEGGVDELVDHLLGAGPERLHHPGGEGLGHQAPQPGVVGRVPEEERARLDDGLGHGVVGRRARSEALGHPVEVDVLGVGARPPVAEDGQAVGVAGEHPEAQLAPVDRGRRRRSA